MIEKLAENKIHAMNQHSINSAIRAKIKP